MIRVTARYAPQTKHTRAGKYLLSCPKAPIVGPFLMDFVYGKVGS